MCMKDTDLLIENNVQPILVFQKKAESKANVESSSANLLLLRTTASWRRFSSHFFAYEFSFICSLFFVLFIRNHEESRTEDLTLYGQGQKEEAKELFKKESLRAASVTYILQKKYHIFKDE